ncbi:ribosomal protection-like ABC-F family protein [Tengunoibacter tsumagoiensis]|uniref:ABC transporter ATP-binding protein n=1 Tax=Tengunoibacter tsumagoiensis TaxID=2014871 RepID=A0A402A0C9_9CHLR|nr:ABC-F family ATP-binding cassette domain-containing protein [Tengunoibacter tsumagoiensis]GCE12545.1 ABC transporter ATP-binding protein [Tengunoibacter tsumagoiensis]
MLLSVHNLTKTYGTVSVLEALSFTLQKNDRVGLVGPNGVGKSTLLRILMGLEEADTGTVLYAPTSETGYLPQSTPDFEGQNLEELLRTSVGNLTQLEDEMHHLEMEMAQASSEQLTMLLERYTTVSTRFQDHGGYDIDYKIDRILAGLRIDYLPRTQSVETLSGGEKARLRLATLLLQTPDLLFLDEPTNHLDGGTMQWLEQYLTAYPGAILMVSHDRQFLNQAAKTIYELDEHTQHLKIYPGNYDSYIQAKARERQKWEEDYERQQEELAGLRKRIKVTGRQIGHTNRAIRDNDKCARYFFSQNVQSAVASNIRSAQAQLELLEAEALPKPPELLAVTTRFQTEPLQSASVIQLTQLSKSYGERQLFNQFTVTVSARARIMITGPNGIGKTTLLRIICGLDQPDSGTVQIVSGARIGYLAQDPELPNLDTTVIETYRSQQIGYEGEMIGKLLGYGFFRLEDMQKTVRHLSLGQRRKLELACLMAQSPNILLLDEPTNYISLDVLEAFENAILTFPGPVIVISHDRWFIDRFGGERWELTHTIR